MASDACGCTADLIAPLNDAFRFRLGDPESLADALSAVIERPMPEAMLRAHVDKFNLSVTVDTVRRLYADSCQ